MVPSIVSLLRGPHYHHLSPKFQFSKQLPNCSPQFSISHLCLCVSASYSTSVSPLFLSLPLFLSPQPYAGPPSYYVYTPFSCRGFGLVCLQFLTFFTPSLFIPVTHKSLVASFIHSGSGFFVFRSGWWEICRSVI